MNPSEATVIVVAYHGDAWLPRCISSLKASLERPVRLLLVDNGGSTRLRSFDLSGQDALVLRCERPLGFAEANNFALQNVDFTTEAVVFLNQDTQSGSGWLDRCLDTLRAHPHLGAVTPLLTTYDGDGWDPGFLECAGRSAVFREHLGRGQDWDEHYEVPQATAAALVVRTAALLQAGPFDPIFGSYYEDYDLCRRITEAGYRIAVCGRAQVAHFSGSATTSPAGRRRRVRQILRNRVIHQVRCSCDRATALLNYFLRSFPYNLARSVCGTASSAPLTEYLAAHGDLVRILGRLVSRHRDTIHWHRYLQTLEWPSTDPSRPSHNADAYGPQVDA